MMKHTEAQKLREELYTLRNTLGFISGKRGKKAEAERAQLKAREDEIHKALEDAPPSALSPDEIWNYIEGWAKRIIKREADLKKSFLDRFSDNPDSAFSSWGQDLIIYSHMAVYAKKVIEFGEGEPYPQARTENILASLTALAVRLQEEIVREARSGYMRSTNSMGNLLGLWRVEADAKLYDELVGQYGGIHVDSLVESFRAWQEWQKELEEGAE